MSTSSIIKGILESDVALRVAATGGIYSFESLGREGITSHTAPNAYSNAVLQPSVLVKTYDKHYTGDLVDAPSQLKSYIQIIYVYCLSHIGFDKCEEMGTEVYRLLAEKRIDGLGFLHIANTNEGDEAEEVSGTPYIRYGFQLYGFTKVDVQ